MFDQQQFIVITSANLATLVTALQAAGVAVPDNMSNASELKITVDAVIGAAGWQESQTNITVNG